MEATAAARYIIRSKSRMASLTALPYVVLDTTQPATRGAYDFKIAKSFSTLRDADKFAQRKNAEA